MKTLFRKTSVILLITVAFASISAYAQFADSSAGRNALRGNPVIDQKYLPAQPTPIVNNITQVTQVIQPSVSVSEGIGDGIRFANAYADCGGVLLGGGGSCTAADGYASMPTSQPNGNGWQVICDAFQGGYVVARAWATCSN